MSEPTDWLGDRQRVPVWALQVGDIIYVFGDAPLSPFGRIIEINRHDDGKLIKLSYISIRSPQDKIGEVKSRVWGKDDTTLVVRIRELESDEVLEARKALREIGCESK